MGDILKRRKDIEMKRLGITYTMGKDMKEGRYKEVAESYIELPIREEGTEQCTSGMKCGIHYIQLVGTIKSIARLQGYTFLEIETVEEV